MQGTCTATHTEVRGWEIASNSKESFDDEKAVCLRPAAPSRSSGLRKLRRERIRRNSAVRQQAAAQSPGGRGETD